MTSPPADCGTRLRFFERGEKTARDFPLRLCKCAQHFISYILTTTATSGQIRSLSYKVILKPYKCYLAVSYDISHITRHSAWFVAFEVYDKATSADLVLECNSDFELSEVKLGHWPHLA